MMFINKGIKKFGYDGHEATKQELYKNLFGMNVITNVKQKDLNDKLCINVLKYLIFLNKEGVIK